MLTLTLLAVLLGLATGHNFKPDGTPAFHPKKPRNVDDSIKVWPHPQAMTTSNTAYSIDKTEFKVLTNVECPLLDQAIPRYLANAFLADCSRWPHSKPQEKTNKTFVSDVQLKILQVKLNKKCGRNWPNFLMDEMYSLTVANGQANLVADTVWGAMLGLETFTQLVQPIDGDIYMINETKILDFPRFRHRGLLLDTSRHFLGVDILLENIDAMAYNKLNVFHWHIVDDQSFPFVSSRYPDLSKKGAYNPNTHIYTPEDVQKVIEYARQRGIRVLVEFDTPGHTQSWGKGQPGLLTPCYTGSQPNGQYGPVDPTKDSTYAFMKNFFGEVVKTFPDNYVHLGGDEVSFDCWQSNPDIKTFMMRKNITDYGKLEEYYIQKLLDIMVQLNQSYIIWQEVFDNKVRIKSDTVVHVWKDGWQKEMLAVTQSNYQALLSSCWYLNNGVYAIDWQDYYTCDPQNFGGTEQQNKLVMGGEAALWGEYVDGSNAISRTWPRASAVAERLWSSKSLTSPMAAENRFQLQHCRMQQRGVRVQPPDGPGFCQCDYAI